MLFSQAEKTAIKKKTSISDEEQIVYNIVKRKRGRNKTYLTTSKLNMILCIWQDRKPFVSNDLLPQNQLNSEKGTVE